jgi:heterodisulfide reductase subunit A-like polyferredoxin
LTVVASSLFATKTQKVKKNTMSLDNAPASSPTNQCTTCTLCIEDFKDVMSNSAYVDENWKCRDCGLLPSRHPRAPQGNNIEFNYKNKITLPLLIS